MDEQYDTVDISVVSESQMVRGAVESEIQRAFTLFMDLLCEITPSTLWRP